MVSVTQRIRKVKQPRGGYIKPKAFSVTELSVIEDLNEGENIHGNLVGLSVDYLTRLLNGTPIKEAFNISLMGAHNVGKLELANDLLRDINGTDDTSIANATKLVGFDVAYRAGLMGYKPVEFINPDEETVSNIRTMVNRGLYFIKLYGPIVKEGFTFEGAYTPVINTGDGDFLTGDTLWDFKVSKSAPTKNHTLQLLIYYLMGIRSTHIEFQEIENLGIYNPRLNKVYLLPISEIPTEITDEVTTTVIGY